MLSLYEALPIADNESLNEGFLKNTFNPSTSELLARKFRALANRTTFADKVGNAVGGIKGYGKDTYHIGRVVGRATRASLMNNGRFSFKDAVNNSRDINSVNAKRFERGTNLLTAGLASALLINAYRNRRNKNNPSTK